MKRFAASIVLLIAVFVCPWWLTLAAIVLCLFYFKEYYEAFFLGIIMDSLYNAPVPLLYHFQFFITIIVVILFVIIEYAKGRLKFYR